MTLKTELLPHQQAAVDKLIGIRVGALYMEMGTGKTRTALEMIQRRLAAGKIDHVLWLCPCSVRQNLRADIAKHSSGAPIAVFGIESLSASLTLFEKLQDYIAAGRTMLVVDESNLVKNSAAIRTQRIMRLAEKCPYRLILNGTPISRNEADLFAQWYILDWRILDYRSFYSFAHNHIEYDPERPGKIKRTLNTDYLVEKIAPYSYQIGKEQCFTLPDKCYEVRRYQMTPEQDGHYGDIVEHMLAQLDERQPETVYRMFAAAQAVISGLWVTDDGRHFRTRPMFADPRDNPRMQELLDAVEELPEGEQCIIFAKYTHEILSILEVLGDAATPFYGKLNATAREKSLQRFRDGEARFLVANKACAGYGLNLQFCHNLIYYSNDWDYATRVQSEDRVHRMGQEHEVHIVDVCAVASLDMRIMDCLQRKSGLSESIKSELNAANDEREAKGKFRKWLRGELGEQDREAVPGH